MRGSRGSAGEEAYTVVLRCVQCWARKEEEVVAASDEKEQRWWLIAGGSAGSPHMVALRRLWRWARKEERAVAASDEKEQRRPTVALRCPQCWLCDGMLPRKNEGAMAKKE